MWESRASDPDIVLLWASDPDIVMLWVVYNVAFFSFLRIVEMVVPDDAGFDAAMHLCRQDIGVDNTNYPSIWSR